MPAASARGFEEKVSRLQKCFSSRNLCARCKQNDLSRKHFSGQSFVIKIEFSPFLSWNFYLHSERKFTAISFRRFFQLLPTTLRNCRENSTRFAFIMSRLILRISHCPTCSKIMLASININVVLCNECLSTASSRRCSCSYSVMDPQSWLRLEGWEAWYVLEGLRI